MSVQNLEETWWSELIESTRNGERKEDPGVLSSSAIKCPIIVVNGTPGIRYPSF